MLQVRPISTHYGGDSCCLLHHPRQLLDFLQSARMTAQQQHFNRDPDARLLSGTNVRRHAEVGSITSASIRTSA